MRSTKVLRSRFLLRQRFILYHREYLHGPELSELLEQSRRTLRCKRGPRGPRPLRSTKVGSKCFDRPPYKTTVSSQVRKTSLNCIVANENGRLTFGKLQKASFCFSWRRDWSEILSQTKCIRWNANSVCVFVAQTDGLGRCMFCAKPRALEGVQGDHRHMVGPAIGRGSRQDVNAQRSRQLYGVCHIPLKQPPR